MIFMQGVARQLDGLFQTTTFARSNFLHAASLHIAETGFFGEISTCKQATVNLGFDRSCPLLSINFGRQCLDFIEMSKTPYAYLPATTALAKSSHRFPFSGTNEGQK